MASSVAVTRSAEGGVPGDSIRYSAAAPAASNGLAASTRGLVDLSVPDDSDKTVVVAAAAETGLRAEAANFDTGSRAINPQLAAQHHAWQQQAGSLSATRSAGASSLSSAPIATTTIATSSSTTTSTPSANEDHLQQHTHRQNHSSSKLPAYRFADLRRHEDETGPHSLPALSLPHGHAHQPSSHTPPSPVSPSDDPTQIHHTQIRQPLDETQPNSAAHQPLSAKHHLYQQQPSPQHPPRQQQQQHVTQHTRTGETQVDRHSGPAPSESCIEDPARSPIRTRASTFQSPSSIATAVTSETTHHTKRTVSLDSTTADVARVHNIVASRTRLFTGPTDSTETIVPLRPEQRRAPASSSLDGTDASSGNQSNIKSQQVEIVESPQDYPAGQITKDWAQGQRELLLPKTIQRSMSDEKRSSVTRRPPVSYKPPVNTNASGGTASIPPIRAFRSSGSRRSLTLDMNLHSPHGFDAPDDFGDSNHRDRTLRALEGRPDDYSVSMTPPDSARADGDDSGDVFLRIAREEQPPRAPDENRGYGDTQSEVSRASRATRRPMSAAVNTYQPSSPPQITRRMSEQETSRTRDFGDDILGDRLGRQNTVTHRGLSRERIGDDSKARVTTGLRSSPMTPRTLTSQEPPPDSMSPHSRRRQTSIDVGHGTGSRLNSLKQSGSSLNHGRSYNSSPLVPKSADPQKYDLQQEQAQGVEGTDSTTSTAAPSTVWDELDDLKSRIHRLELTGKLPPTSGAAMSRASDERPATAHTTATTMSSSPKRGSGGGAQATDVASTTSSQREAHPVLQSALAKSKQLLSAEVYAALETAATDALSLSSMMGIAGQPGPISSAASGVGGGPAVTDRQLRRKADSICRSITELCIALSEGTPEVKPESTPVPAPSPEKSPVTSPTVTRFTGFPTHTRRTSIIVDRNMTFTATSPRATSRVDDKRANMLVTALPSPRFAPSANANPLETNPTGRKSSLLLSRTRRAQTEEPDEGRQSSLLRTRRAGTEEPEEPTDRKTSLLLRTRRAGTEEPEDTATRKPTLITRARRKTIENEEDDPRLRAPSRAVTELNGLRSPREYASHVPTPTANDTAPLGSSALPRRRLPPTSLASRIVPPTPPSTMASRRFLDRSTPDRESMPTVDRMPEDQVNRRFSLAQPSSLSRTGSVTRRPNRESMIAVPSGSTAPSGAYR